jgi:predicted transcriptional regulator
MATVTYSAIDEIMQDITSSIPGPQEGESIFDYRARVNQRLMEVVDAVSDHKRRVDAFIRDHSETKVDDTDQFYNAVRQRFIADEFEE